MLLNRVIFCKIQNIQPHKMKEILNYYELIDNTILWILFYVYNCFFLNKYNSAFNNIEKR